MSARYVPVSWTRSKIIYDAVLIAAVSLFLFGYESMARRAGMLATPLDEGSLAIRTFGTCAFMLITCALAIGPMARLDRRFLPLLYNRRHLGVVTFAVAAAHAWACLDWYFAFSPLDPWSAMLASDTGFTTPRALPYVPFGMAALLMLAVLAATSHDFWLKFLGPGLWKSIHLGIYVSYACVVIHLAFGPLQSAQSPALPALVLASAAGLITLHLTAGLKERRSQLAAMRTSLDDRWMRVARASEIPESRAVTVHPLQGEAIAIFNDGGHFTAVRNRCAHQNGPLGEGRVIGGCIVCPWHGYEYRLRDGCAPAPFTEKIETYNLRLVDGVLFVDPRPNEIGTPVEPVKAEGVPT